MVRTGVYRGLGPQGIIPEALNSCSGTLLPEHFRRLRHQSRQPDQVVRRATEDEQPVHFLQAAQLDLAQRAGLLQPSESLFDQPSPAKADALAGLARVLRSRLLARPLSFFVTCGVTFSSRAVP